MPSYCPRTGKCEADVVIQHDNFPHCTRILQLENRLLFYPQDRYILAAYPDLKNINTKCRQKNGQELHTAQVPFRTASNAYSTCMITRVFVYDRLEPTRDQTYLK